MSDGRTPTMTLAGSVSVVLEDLYSAFPFPAIVQDRRFVAKKCRDGVADTGLTVRVFDRYDEADETIEAEIPYCTEENYTKLRTLIQANPPTVNVTYLHLSSQAFDFVSLAPIPDDWDWINEKTFKTKIKLLRQTVTT